MYNSIHLIPFVQVTNGNGSRLSYSFAWARTFLMKWFPSGNIHSSKSKCTAEITWFDQRLNAEQAAFWCPTSWAAGPLGSPPQGWQELRSWAHKQPASTQLESPQHCWLPELRDHAGHQWEISETLFTHSVWWYLFFFPTQNETKFNWQRITLLWLALLFIIYFTVTASYAEICTEPNCGPFLKEFVVWLIELNSIHLIFTYCSLIF